LVSDSAGNLYGAASSGGDLNCDFVGQGCGTIFRMDRTGRLTVLHTFHGSSDGSEPSGLTLDVAGNLYGVCASAGFTFPGTAWKFDSAGKFTVLHSFKHLAATGYEPAGRLLLDAAGNIYGTTTLGGSGTKCGTNDQGCGVVFKITP
jgi:uncharacterized repeat protein (TIGR03803 family)